MQSPADAETVQVRDPERVAWLSQTTLSGDETMATVRGLAAVAERRGQTLAQLALAWALRDPRMTSLIIGASSVAQLEGNVAALDNLDLAGDDLAEIEGLLG